MPITQHRRPIAAARIETVARGLLDASTLCAIATVSARGRAHVNTAYFAWSPKLDVVWLSEPAATHSRNLRGRSTAAIAVYDSSQSWGESDRGIQLFGSAREVEGRAAKDAKRMYSGRFPGYDGAELGAYRFYRFRPRRVKLFDERSLGPGVFVTARIGAGGEISWDRTDLYVSAE
jgi:uncharacterized protein YhbP (UPF0306 family)